MKLSHILFSVKLKVSSASSVSSKLLDSFCCAKKAAYHEVASFIRYQYKREVFYEKNILRRTPCAQLTISKQSAKMLQVLIKLIGEASQNNCFQTLYEKNNQKLLETTFVELFAHSSLSAENSKKAIKVISGTFLKQLF